MVSSAHSTLLTPKLVYVQVCEVPSDQGSYDKMSSEKQEWNDNAIYVPKNYIIYSICPILIDGPTKVDINLYCL